MGEEEDLKSSTGRRCSWDELNVSGDNPIICGHNEAKVVVDLGKEQGGGYPCYHSPIKSIRGLQRFLGQDDDKMRNIIQDDFLPYGSADLRQGVKHDLNFKRDFFKFYCEIPPSSQERYMRNYFPIKRWLDYFQQWSNEAEFGGI